MTNTNEVLDLTKATLNQVIDAAISTVEVESPGSIYDILESLEYGDELPESNYEVTLVEHYGGEGSGDKYYDVFTVVDKADDNNLTYFKVEGYYSSYNGTDYPDDIYGSSKLVSPREKIITVYE